MIHIKPNKDKKDLKIKYTNEFLVNKKDLDMRYINNNNEKKDITKKDKEK